MSKNIEDLKAILEETRKQNKLDREEIKEQIRIQNELDVLRNSQLQTATVVHEATVQDVESLKARMELAATAVEDSHLTTKTGKDIKLSFFAGRHSSVVVATLMGLLNGLVHTRDDASEIGARVAGLNTVDVATYSLALGQTQKLDEDTGILYPGMVGNAEELASILELLANKLAVTLPASLTFDQSVLDKVYQDSVDRVEALVTAKTAAEDSWDEEEGFKIDL